MSREWFDPFGIRGSKLDPMTHLANALAGRGLAATSAARMSTTVARQLEGRRLEIASDPPIAATVSRLDEVRPPAGVGAVPTSVTELPMFAAISGQVRNVRIGDLRFDVIQIDARDLRVGATGDRLRLGGADYEARVGTDDVLAQLGALLDDPPLVRFDNGRIEGSEGVLARWFWMEVRVRAADKRVTIEPVAVRFLGRPIPVPRQLMRTVHEDLPALPAPLTVDDAQVAGDELVVRGTVREVVIPVNVARLMTDLGTQTTRSALKVMIGEW